jgi:hypothetical protein
MGIFERLQNLDKRVFYLFMALAIAIPTISPLGIPVDVTPAVQKTFDFIRSLPDGSKVLMGFDYEPGDEIELSPQAVALFHEFAAKHFKVVAIASFPSAPNFAEDTLKTLDQYGYKYGEDYVDLGYYAGSEATLAAFGTKPLAIFPKDWRGNDTSAMPLTKDLKSMKDFTLAITLGDGPTGGTNTDMWVRQSVMAHGINLVMGLTGVLAAPNQTYVQSGQCKGILAGLRAAAELEKLTGKIGPGTVGMDAQSIAHVLIVIFVVLGNVGMFLSKKPKIQPAASKGGGK